MLKTTDLPSMISSFSSRFPSNAKVTVNHHIAVIDHTTPRQAFVNTSVNSLALIGVLLGDIGGLTKELPDGFRRVRVTLATMYALDGQEPTFFDIVEQTQVIPVDACLTPRDQEIMNAALLDVLELRDLDDPLSANDLKLYFDSADDFAAQGQFAFVVAICDH